LGITPVIIERIASSNSARRFCKHRSKNRSHSSAVFGSSPAGPGRRI
jgi:hypothetical protein